MKSKAQVFIEFALSFFLLILFIVLTVVLFVWFSNNVVGRNTEYQKTRVNAGNGSTTAESIDFYNQSEHKLKIFND